jgi:hypothetical protein
MWLILQSATKLAMPTTCFHAHFLRGLFFDPDDGGNMFLRKTSVDFQRVTLLYIPDNTLHQWEESQIPD